MIVSGWKALIEFDDWVRKLLEQVPEGHVTTFGNIAEGLGDPVAARAVGERIHLQESDWYACRKDH